MADGLSAPAILPEKAGEAKALVAEHRIAVIRQLVIAFNTMVYFLWIDPAVGIMWLAVTVLSIANAYGIYVIVAQPYRTWPVMRSAGFTSVTDGALITLWLIGTGGAASEFYLLWYLSLVAISFRYDVKGTLYATAAYVALYVTVSFGTATMSTYGVEVLIRCGYIALVGALGALMAGETTAQFRGRLEAEANARELDRFRVLSDASFEGILVHKGGVIIEANQALSELVGMPVKELIGMHVLQLVSEESAGVVASRLAEPTEEPVETWIKRADGTQFLAQAQGRATPNLAPGTRVVAVRDITHAKVAEDAQRDARLQRDEVERLAKLDQMKTQFINTAAHELNTPLTPIRLQLHMLRENADALGPKEKRGLEMLDRNLGRLTRLVRDMLDVSRLQNGKLPLQLGDVEVGPVVNSIVETFNVQAQEKGLIVLAEIEDGLEITADQHRLEQVLVNLLSNAIKFTPSGGTIRVNAERAEDMVRIRVRDTGAGLMPDQLAALFQPFVQHHTDLAQIGAGTGLGLFICKGLVEAHGGSIDISSDGEGQGVTVQVMLPIEPMILAESE